MYKTLNEIKKLFDLTPLQNIENLIDIYKNDTRITVQNFIKSYEKKLEGYRKELIRVKNMNKYESIAFNQGKKLIAGLDEVGRGPLAGPLVTASVILPQNTIIYGINDSKKVSQKKRELLFKEIEEKAIEITINMEDNEVIDSINILEATKLSMKKNVLNFKNTPDYLIIDMVDLKSLKIPCISMAKADELSISVAAASIIAKVTRDNYMLEMHKKYPQYLFNKNKGYGTKEHIEAIKNFGYCPIHRKSFIKNFI